MKVDVVRASMFYSLCVLLYEIYLIIGDQLYDQKAVNWHLIAICALIFLISIAETPRRIRKVVRTEYFFIIAAARIRDDLILNPKQVDP
jgi:hypothetical protein